MAAAASQRVWHDLCLSPAELRISHTLQSGQTFRWKQTGSQEWASVLNGQLIALKETDTTTLFTVLTTPSPLSSDEIAETTSVLTSYFQTHVNLHDCYQRWSALDTNFRAKALYFPGVRILAQDPWENLISFICSANNHIKRITSMVDQLATHFGQHVADHNGHAFYHFPTVSDLNHPTLETQLRQLGFGYRAKYIHQTVQHLHYKHGQQATKWLQSLRQIPYLEARDELLQLAGIGPKVADCICLMSLDKPEAIPVDTHVWQIARRDYAFRHPPSGSHKGSKVKCVLPERPKALSKGEYQAVGDHFRTLFGAYAGWAHSVLFIADLATNSPKKTPGVAKVVAKTATKSTKASRPAAMLLPTRRSRRLNGITRMLET